MQDYAARGRASTKLIELIETTEWPELRRLLDDRAQVNWAPNWRGRPHIEDGNAREGWAAYRRAACDRQLARGAG